MTQNRINTKRLKANLKPKDYEKIFKALNVPIFSKGQKYWTLYTGCHHANPYEGSPKLLYYPSTGLCQCLTQCSCSMDIIALTQRRLALLKLPSSFIDAINFILEVTGLELEEVKRINSPNVCNWQSGLERFVRFRQTGTDLRVYDKSILSQLGKIYPQQWLDEGISSDTLDKYQIGYYARTQATTIPCFDKDGRLVGIRVRNWNPELVGRAKYLPLILLNETSYQFPTNDVFFNINWAWPEIERTGVVTLVEGEKSCMKADTWYGDKSNVLGLYGSNIGLKRRNQLIKMGVKEVNLALDSDFHEIGDNEEYNKFETKIMNISKLFKGYATVNVIYNNLGLNGYKCSPFDFDKATFEELYREREIII